MTLSGSGADTAGSITEISNKLKRQVNYWSRFNLSLPGCITVAKSMLYSQINYLGCFLHLSERVIESYSSIIEKYVSGKLNIAKNRLTKSIEMGGLGLFDLTTFLDAQRVTWVKRAKSIDDWWKLSRYSRSMGDVFNVRSKDFNMEREPCLYTIVKSYEKFLVNFTKHGNNYKKAYLFSNNALNLGLRDRRVVDKNLFTAAFFAEHGQRIKKLLISDFLNEDGTYLNRENFVINTGIPFPLLTFQQLRGVVDTARIRYHSREEPEMVSVDIRTFINRSRTGSKRFRKILSVEISNYIPHNIVKFSDNMEIVAGLEDSKKINKLWNNGLLANSTRTFLFKLHNNTLGYNASVSHFVRHHSRNCTFCDIAGNQDVNDETPIHLFFQCDSVSRLLEEMFKWLTNDNTFDYTRKKLFTFFDRADLTQEKNIILTYASKTILKFVWDSKQRFCLPNINHCKTTLMQELDCLSKISNKFRNTLTRSGYTDGLDIGV